MGNNSSRYAGYPDSGYGAYDQPGTYGARLHRGWSNTNKRKHYNSAGWYPGEMGYRQPSYQQPYPPYYTMQQQQPQIIPPPGVQYVQIPVPQAQPQPQVVYQQMPVQQVPVQVMPQPVIPNVPTTGRRPVIPTAQYQNGPAVPMPEPVIPIPPRQDQQSILTQPTVHMPEPEPAPPQGPPPQAPPPEEPSMSFPEPQNPPTFGTRLAPGQYSAFDRPPTPPRNPPPPPPKDLFELSPYMHILEELKRPIDENTIKRSHTVGPLQSVPMYTTTPQPQYGSQRERRHKKSGGIFRSLSARLNPRRNRSDGDENEGGPSRHAGSYGVVPMMYTIPESSTLSYNTALPNVIPGHVNRTPSMMSMHMPGPTPGPGSRPGTPRPPPIRIERNGELGGLLHSSQHRVLYNHKLYPTAAHLLEALKFLDHQPELAERVRACGSAEEAAAVAASMPEHVRPDWEEVVVPLMEEALYHKFIQHPDMRRLLMSTGVAELVYAEVTDSFWGDGPVGQGLNELGKALMRVRDHLRAEGMGTPMVHPIGLRNGN